MHAAPTTLPHLQLHGYPTLARGGRPLALKLKHGLALLARLAAQPAPQGRPLPLGRDALAALLWPDAEPGTGRARLRRLVHELHGVLGCAVVEATPDTLALAPGCSSDLAATRLMLQRLQRPGPLDAAAAQALAAPQAALWLDGFVLGSDAFDAWAESERRHHATTLARALEQAAQRALAHADATLADALATALLRLDPCHEAGHAARMAARALRRDAAGVETAYFDCAERLRAELGVRPSAALEAAYVEAIGQARADPMQLAIQFAPTGHGHVAYAAWGQGEQTIVVLWGLVSNLEVALDEPRARAFLDALAREHRVVMIDRRGTGLSERIGVQPGPETTAEDIGAVLDHLGVPRAWLFGSSVGGTLALDFALRRPERTAGLLLWGTSPSGRWTPQTPWALKPETFDAWVQRLTDPRRYDESLQRFAPSAANDPWVKQWYARLLRNGCSRIGAIEELRAYQQMDLRGALGRIRVPTLVLQRRGDRVVPLAAGQQLAAAIPQARFQALDGDDHFLWHGDSESVLRAVQGFTAARRELPAWQQCVAA